MCYEEQLIHNRALATKAAKTALFPVAAVIASHSSNLALGSEAMVCSCCGKAPGIQGSGWRFLYASRSHMAMGSGRVVCDGCEADWPATLSSATAPSA